MESLYRKYRPLTFESVVGQQHIVSTLEHAVAEGRLSHAYLFCGPRGTGKTTMARILAKSLLCEGAEAARATGASGCMPDGSCPECEAIAAGTHPDVYELDAASRTGVDNVREEIINSVSFAPVRGAYKVYIIDEVHMLTTAAFNALLKTLEEPPSHVIFVLCTTDPQKILETILSRCQRFDFHRISNDDIVGRLRFICEQEGFAFDEEALEIVARHARGGMRDALSTLEQLSVFGDGSVRVDDARSLLGEVASTVLSEFARNIAARDTVALFGLVRAQADEGNDLMELTHDLVAHMRDVYTAAIAGAKAELFDGTPDEVAGLVEEARLFEDADRLARALTVLDDAALEMRNASDPRLVLEIALTRLARPEGDLTLEALAERLARLEAQLAAGVPSAPMGAAQLAAMSGAHGGASSSAPRAAAGAARTATPAGPSGAAAGVAHAVAGGAAAPASMPANAPASPSVSGSGPAPRPAAPQPAPAPAGVPAPSSGAPVSQVGATVAADSQPEMAACAVTPPAADEGDLQRRWADAVKRITAAQPSRGGLLQSSRAVSDDGETLTIGFPKGSTFALKMITRPDSAGIVMPVVCQVFGRRTVTYVMEGAASAPAARPTVPVPATPQPVLPAVVPAPMGSTLAAAPAAPASASAASTAAADDAARPTASPVAAAAVPASQSAAVSSASATPVSRAASVQPSFVSAPRSPSPEASAPSTPAQDSPVQSEVSSDSTAATTADPVRARGVAPVGARGAKATPVRTDQVSGPTVLPERDIEADRRAWEDEQVPYDDAAIAAYVEEDERPPFDAPVSDSASIAKEPSEGSASGADVQAEAADPKAVLDSIWGNVIYK